MCYIYLIVFILFHLQNWNNLQTDNTHYSQIDWHTDENSQTYGVSSRNSQIIQLAIHRLQRERFVNPRLTFEKQSNLGCVCNIM